jgi:hypothetical protein
MTAWFIESIDKEALGPYETNDLREALEAANVPVNARVCAVGTERWRPWTEFAELRHLAQPDVAAQEHAPPPAVDRKPARSPVTFLATFAPWVLGGVAIVGVAITASRSATQHRELAEELAETKSNLDSTQERLATATASASGLAARIGELESQRSAMADAMREIALRTERIGFSRLAWEYKGLLGVTSLDVFARPAKNNTHCSVSGNFQRRGNISPSLVKAQLLSDGGEVVHESAVDIGGGSFVMEAPKSCDAYSKLVLSAP